MLLQFTETGDLLEDQSKNDDGNCGSKMCF